MQENMSRVIHVKNVPDDVHRTLKARAAREGMSLSDFIRKQLQKSIERPTMLEWLDRVGRRKPIPTKRSAAQVLRELRHSR